jgi:cbb3-type cytochrome oxidase subunit 3
LHLVLYTNLRKFSNSLFLVQLIIFLYVVSSFMFNHLLVRNFTHQLGVLYISIYVYIILVFFI